ncbi:MAG: hypothetical protein H7A44_05070 [Opitutaceae bacterium]|nr:hypothetical protein [Cephaloticoccus sp.]MCP5529793.1 hypothetical protein [Opitutaceae bacterium]
MSLTPEQTQAVASWVAAGDNLSVVQKKLREEFNVAMTYMDVRFLVDDLELTLTDKPEPKADVNDVSKGAPADKPEPEAQPADDSGDDLDEALPPGGGGNVSVALDEVTLIPGALASGSVTFSDGVTGKWIVDHSGRPGFTEISQPGYRPNPADAQAFMQQLSQALQTKGY